jgi:hypothetical protein
MICVSENCQVGSSHPRVQSSMIRHGLQLHGVVQCISHRSAITITIIIIIITIIISSADTRSDAPAGSDCVAENHRLQSEPLVLLSSTVHASAISIVHISLSPLSLITYQQDSLQHAQLVLALDVNHLVLHMRQ